MSETVCFNLEVNADPAYTDIRRLQTVLYRTMGLLRRFSGSEEIDSAMMKIQQLIMIIRHMQLMWRIMQAEMGPIGWAMMAVTIGSTAFVMTDFVNEIDMGDDVH